MAGEGDGSDPRDLWRQSGRYMGFGLTWALSVLLFGGLGYWLDGRIGTTPIFVLVGAFAGAGAGFYYLYYHLVIEPRHRDRTGTEK